MIEDVPPVFEVDGVPLGGGEPVVTFSQLGEYDWMTDTGVYVTLNGVKLVANSTVLSFPADPLAVKTGIRYMGEPFL